MTAFKGEQAITSAMIDLVEGKKNMVGYVSATKNRRWRMAPPKMSPTMQPEPGEHSPISIMKTFIENENIKLSRN